MFQSAISLYLLIFFHSGTLILIPSPLDFSLSDTFYYSLSGLHLSIVLKYSLLTLSCIPSYLFNLFSSMSQYEVYFSSIFALQFSLLCSIIFFRIRFISPGFFIEVAPFTRFLILFFCITQSWRPKGDSVGALRSVSSLSKEVYKMSQSIPKSWRKACI